MFREMFQTTCILYLYSFSDISSGERMAGHMLFIANHSMGMLKHVYVGCSVAGTVFADISTEENFLLAQNREKITLI